MSTDTSSGSGRFLSLAERQEIAILRAQQIGVRAIARRLSRDPATISRELRRNAATEADSSTIGVERTVARRPASERPKVAKLAANARLHDSSSSDSPRPALWHTGVRPAGALDRSASRPPAGPPVGAGVEPGADLEP